MSETLVLITKIQILDFTGPSFTTFYSSLSIQTVAINRYLEPLLNSWKILVMALPWILFNETVFRYRFVFITTKIFGLKANKFLFPFLSEKLVFSRRHGYATYFKRRSKNFILYLNSSLTLTLELLIETKAKRNDTHELLQAWDIILHNPYIACCLEDDRQCRMEYNNLKKASNLPGGK